MAYRILLTNDDGIDSPALMVFADALGRIGEVTVVAPSQERSWVGKAISRHSPLTMERVSQRGVPVYAVDGFPADCTELGVDLFGDGGPDLVVSGINVGYNHGEAFLLSSGTVGAAMEAAIRSIPAVAVSAGTNGHWPTWQAMAWSEQSAPMWQRLAPLAAEIIEPILNVGFPTTTDVVSINMPEDANDGTERRTTRIAASRYEGIFTPNGDGGYRHELRGHRIEGDAIGTDIEASRHGAISITPILLPTTGGLSRELVAAWDVNAAETGDPAE